MQFFKQPFLRRLITRAMSLIPAMIVAFAVGRSGIDQLLVASQVVLSIVLPFIIFPLVWLTTSKDIMSVKKPGAGSDDAERGEDKVDFSNGKVAAGFGYAIWL